MRRSTVRRINLLSALISLRRAFRCALITRRTIIASTQSPLKYWVFRIRDVQGSKRGTLVLDGSFFIAVVPGAESKLFVSETLKLQCSVNAPLKSFILMVIAAFPEQSDINTI